MKNLIIFNQVGNSAPVNRLFIWMLIIFLFQQFHEPLHSQNRKVIDEILYGVAYYTEYMPYERIEEDARLMKEAGINTVRIAESTWSVLEPKPGEFSFDHIDPVLDIMHKYGIHVIVGTPTYAIPPWMAEKHPEIMVKTFDGQARFGGRQNMDITNKDYLFYCERVMRALMEHVHEHPAIIGYQIDNETKSYKTATDNANRLFIDHLKEKFKTTDSLNKVWNLAYWSQTISNWDEFQVTGAWANQAIHLEWYRFQHQLVTDFLQFQYDIVKEYVLDDQFITQNFDLWWRGGQSSGPHPDVDHFNSAKVVDIAGIDIYHDWGDKFDGWMINFAGDYTRSFKMDNYFVIETQAQARGWSTINQLPLYDGQLRQAFYSHLANGANMVAYWPWHSIHNGGETFWKGILSHDMKPNRTFREAQKISSEIKNLGEKLVNIKPRSEIAILYSIESFNALRVKPFSENITYADLVNQVHRSLFEQNTRADFITPADTARFKDYSLIIVPPLYVSNERVLKNINDYVHDGGTVVMMFKSGFMDENSNVRPVEAPGILKESCGFHYQEFYNIEKIPFAENPFYVREEDNYGYGFAELLIPASTKPLVEYKHHFMKKFPAVTMNEYGKGILIYEACMVSDEIQKRILADAMNKAGIKNEMIVENPSFPVIIRSGRNQQDKQIHYLFNYSAQPVEKKVTGNCMELTEGKQYGKNELIKLLPWSVYIFEE